jgi:hypothetical protein
VRSLLADLTADVRMALAENLDTPATGLPDVEQLEAVFNASTPYIFQAGVLSVHTDPRWFLTLPAGGPGAPLLELRRWPGDTVVGLYAVTGAPGPDRPGGPPLADASLEFAEAAEDGSYAEWFGMLKTEAGYRPVVWIEVAVPEADSFLGVLMLPGDAGLGASGIADLTLESRMVLGRVRFNAEAWKRLQGLPQGKPVQVPTLGGTPGDKTEEDEPWQVARATDFTVGLPPGCRARRMDAGVPPPTEIPGGQLWIRGRFRDLEDGLVVVGDESRAGYIARVDEISEKWAGGKQAPLGAPAAERKKFESFPLVADRTGAERATAERWSEAGFAGDWMIFRLVFGKVGYEIGLPVVAGRQSASLYWIPATWRKGDEAPAPPPVDPAERFGIRFERLRATEKAGQPFTEGHLTAPGLRAEVPKDWFPLASLRSRDGYPVRFTDATGATRGALVRLSAEELPATDDPEAGWVEDEHPGRHRAVQVFNSADGTLLLIAKEGHGFILAPYDLTDPDDQARWKRLVESMQLIRSARKEKETD